MRVHFICPAILLLLTLPQTTLAASPNLVLPSGPWSDVTCFRIVHGCAEPSEIEATIDTTQILHWVPTTVEAREAPASVCIDVDGLGSGTKTLTVQDTCGGVVESAQATISVDDLGFELLSVDPPARALRPGTSAEIRLHTNATNLNVSVDFSALDSYYTAGSESVVNLGNGSYQVNYLPSVMGSPATGTYTLPIVLTDPATGKSRSWADLVTVDFTPTRAPIFTVMGDNIGEILYADPPSVPPLTPEATIVPSSLTVTNTTLLPGDTTTLSGEFDVYDDEVRNGSATLFIHEVGADGVVVVPIAAQEQGCWTIGGAGTTCRYSFSVDLQMRPLAHELVSLSGPVTSTPAVGVRVSKVDPLLDLPLDITNVPFEHAPPLNWLPNGLPYDRVIRGHVQYRQNVISFGPDINAPDPHFGSAGSSFVATDLAVTRIEVHDGCGGIRLGHTSVEGGYEVFFTSLCPNLVAEVFAVTEATRGYVRTDVRDTMGDLHKHSVGTFVPSDVWVQQIPDVLIPMLPAATFNILQRLIHVQRWSKALLGDQQIGVMPWAHSIYERDWCPNVETTSEYSAETNEIRICSGDGTGGALINRDEFDPYVITHEAFHWFHDQFILQGLSESLYSGPTRDFTEGFAMVLGSLALGTSWRMERLPGGDANSNYGQHAFNVESLDFNGNTAYDLQDNAERWLPVNLWNEQLGGTPASSTGGWAWRILWDVADPEEPFFDEPYNAFNRGEGGAAATIPDDFDEFGSFEMFADVITGYLHPAPANPAMLAVDTRGFADIDTAEFLDGVVCRSPQTWDAEVETLVITVMDYNQYNPAQAPIECP